MASTAKGEDANASWKKSACQLGTCEAHSGTVSRFVKSACHTTLSVHVCMCVVCVFVLNEAESFKQSHSPGSRL